MKWGAILSRSVLMELVGDESAVVRPSEHCRWHQAVSALIASDIDPTHVKFLNCIYLFIDPRRSNGSESQNIIASGGRPLK